MITYGLAPYFKAELVDTVSKPVHAHFAIFFDEAYNEISKKKQNDVLIAFFNEKTKTVSYRYLGSGFLRHGDTTSISQSLIDIQNGLDFGHKCTQLSMDRPNVNWSVMKDVEDQKFTKDPLSPKLLNVGSCSLHVLHGAYKSAQEATDWDVKSILKAAYKLFQNSSARRSVYLTVNDIDDDEDEDEDETVFPKPFCGHRWLENGPALSRLLTLLEKLKNYIVHNNRQAKSKQINTGSLKKVEEEVKNDANMNSCYAKLEFSLFICKTIEPFLLKFQAERPLVPFSYQEMLGVLRSSLDAFVRSSVIESSVTDGNLTKIDLGKEENLRSLQNIDIGFGANSRLKKLNPLQQLKFRGNCQKFYVNFCKKLVERSCLAFTLTELLSYYCFSPRLMRQPNSIWQIPNS